MTSTCVFVTTTFVGFHRWAKAPDQVAYLRDYHRHVFHVKLTVPVSHGDRDVEFIQLKDRVAGYIETRWGRKRFESSCEQIAEELCKAFGGVACEVSEDGENGGLFVQLPPLPQKVTGQGPTVLEAAWPKPAHDQKDAQPHPVLRKRDKCFFGHEAEGPPRMRNRPTLFVPGSASPEMVLAAVDAILERELVLSLDKLFYYYGAGNDREIRWDTLGCLACLVGRWQDRLLVEVEKMTDRTNAIVKRTMFDWVSLRKEDVTDGLADYWKYLSVVDLTVYWDNCRGEVWRTPLHSPLFAKDIDLN